MDLLIAEPLEAEVLQWLDARHELFYSPRLAHDRHLFLEALSDARAVLVPPQVPIDARAIAAAPRLRAIGRVVGGPEQIDLSACTRAGIEVVRCIDAAAPAEAEFLIGALLALMRPSPVDVGRVAGRELGTSTVGLVGINPTARRIATLLNALGSRVVGYDPALHASDPNWAGWGIQPVTLREVFAGSDAVSVQMAYFSRFRGLLGERALRHAKSGQVLVSVSPFDLFDEVVLVDALRSGQLTAAWMDHLPADAIEPGSLLHGVPGLLCTPRLAAYTRDARLRSAWGVARGVDAVLRATPSTARTGMRRRSPIAEQALRAAGLEPDAAAAKDAVPATAAVARTAPPQDTVLPLLNQAVARKPVKPGRASSKSGDTPGAGAPPAVSPDAPADLAA